MKTVLNLDTQAGLEKTDEPRQHTFPNTELGVELKLLTIEPGRMAVGDCLGGMMTRDGEYHYTFVQDGNVEKRTEAVQRNPYVYRGLRINVHRKPDGTLYPTFNRPGYTQFFGFQHFCREAAQELLAVAGLVEEDVRK